MFERYTERARRVLFFARFEASQTGSISIGSEHLLLGLIREGKGLTSRVFARRHLSLPHVRQEIESRMVFREKVPTSVEIPFDADARTILEYAAEEADRLLHTCIGTEHLLLGMLRAEESPAGSNLAEHGLKLQEVRDEIVQLLAQKPPASEHVPQAHLHPAAYAVGGGPPFVRYVPSEHVHIAFAAHEREGIWFSEGPRHWQIAGAGLAALIARAYHTDESRVRLGDGLADQRRYDVTLLLPTDDRAQAIARRVQQAIEEQFRVEVSREVRPDGEVLVVRSVAAGT